MGQALMRDRAPVAVDGRRLPKALPTRRGEVARVSYDESRTWLWRRLNAGDRDVANALWFHLCKRKPKGIKRLPSQLDDLAVRAAAEWVLLNPDRVKAMIAKARSGSGSFFRGSDESEAETRPVWDAIVLLKSGHAWVKGPYLGKGAAQEALDEMCDYCRGKDGYRLAELSEGRVDVSVAVEEPCERTYKTRLVRD